MSDREKKNPSDEDSVTHDPIGSGTGMEEMDNGQEDLNSTMMAIDIANLDLDGATKTEIKLDAPSDEEIIQEQLERKKTPVERFLSNNILKIKKLNFSSLHAPFSKLGEIWICDRSETVSYQFQFYSIRVLLFLFSIFLHYLLFSQTIRIFSTGHPASYIALIVLIIDLAFVILSVWLKYSPGWIVAFPLSVCSIMIAYAALLFHTADPMLFYYNGQPLSELLNSYYIVFFVYSALISCLIVARGMVARISLGLLHLIAIIPFLINLSEKISLEMSFFGTEFLSFISRDYFQPVFIVLQIIIPIIFFLFLFLSFGTGTDAKQKIAKGFSRSLTFMIFVLMIANLSLMQKNRVFHVFNFMVPLKLDIGGAELEVSNQNLKIETINFNQFAGDDSKARYLFSLKKGKKENQFLLQVVDQFNFPVKNVKLSDFEIYNDDVKVDHVKLEEERAINFKRGNYIFEIPLKEKQSLISWDSKVSEYTDKDKIVFELSDISKIKRFTIQENDEYLIDLKYLKDKLVEFPLSYFDEGKHRLVLSLYDQLDQEIFKDYLDIHISVKPDFTLLSPVESDAVEDQLQVLILPKRIQSSSVQSVSYLINDKLVGKSDGSVFFHTIDVSPYPSGEIKLTVKLNLEGGELVRNVVLKKQTHIPNLIINHPQMGEFALRQTDVEYVLSDKNTRIAGIKVFVNGVAFKDFEVKDQKFTLPISRWSQSEIFLTVQAALESGIKVSDWVQVNKGIGVLSIDFDIKSLSFINYKSIGVLLDASISNVDNWQGKEKWKIIKKLITDPLIESRMKHLNPEIMVYGAKQRHYYQDCNDHDTIVKSGQYNLAVLKKKLSEIRPNGVASLYSGLNELLKTSKPDKILLFADSVDPCSKDLLKELMTLIEKSPQTQVVVFALGHLAEKDRIILQKLADKSRGHFYQPDNYEILQKTWVDELVMSYEIFSQGQLIHRAPLENKQFHLVPGQYTLKIPYGNDVKELDLNLENGSNLSLFIQGDQGKIHVTENVQRL